MFSLLPFVGGKNIYAAMLHTNLLCGIGARNGSISHGGKMRFGSVRVHDVAGVEQQAGMHATLPHKIFSPFVLTKSD